MTELTLTEAHDWRRRTERNVEAARFEIRKAMRDGRPVTDGMRKTLQHHHKLMRKARQAVRELLDAQERCREDLRP